jgi:hypothetical protein
LLIPNLHVQGAADRAALLHLLWEERSMERWLGLFPLPNVATIDRVDRLRIARLERKCNHPMV